MKIFTLAFALLLGSLPAFSQGNFQQTALGDFPLENGQVIKNCHLGYRTFGRMSFFREFATIAPRVRAFLEQP